MFILKKGYPVEMYLWNYLKSRFKALIRISWITWVYGYNSLGSVVTISDLVEKWIIHTDKENPLTRTIATLVDKDTFSRK